VLALGSCTAVSGIDDKVFDLPPGTGTGGDAGGGGQGGTGGVVVPACTAEELDVTPRGIYVGDGVGSLSWVAAQPGTFAMVAELPDNDPKRIIGVLGSDGTTYGEDSYNVWGGAFEAHVVSGHGLYAHVVPYHDGGHLQLRFRDAAGLGASAATINTGDNPAQAAAAAIDAGFLVTHADGDGNFYYSLVSGPDWTAGPVTPFSPATTCNSERSWAVAGEGNTAAVAWQSTCTATQWQLALYSSENGMTMAPPLTNTNGAPRFGGPLDSGFVVANCQHLFHVGQDGEVLDSALLFDTNCAIGTDGTSLRMIDVVGSSLRWRALSTDGTPTDVLSFPASPEGAPLIAWDGGGYAIIWREAGEIMYAHVCVPA